MGETKTHVPIEAPFPDVLISYLERYLSEYRPFLSRLTGHWGLTRPLRPPSVYLWISTYGSGMSEGALYDWLTKLTRAKFGHAISPHLFRDIAATSIAVEDPQHV